MRWSKWARQYSIGDMVAATMSDLVLSRMAINSPCSCAGTLNWSSVAWKSDIISLPLLLGYVHVRVCLLHRAARIRLGATCGPAHHFGDPILEPRLWHARPGLVDGRVGVEYVVDHQPFDKVVNHRGDGVDATQPRVQRRGILR